jgi:hypothetical protein
MQERTKVNRIQTAELQDDNLRIAFKEALAISNRHKGVSESHQPSAFMLIPSSNPREATCGDL